MLRIAFAVPGAFCALALFAAAQSGPGPTADGELIRMDAQGREARGFADSLRLRTREEGAARVGAGWEARGPFGGDVDDVNVSSASSSIVLAGIAPSGSIGGTLYRSTDAAASWMEVAALSGTSVHDIEFDPAGKAYLGTVDGVWTSTDGGASWTHQSLGIGLNDQTFEVTIDPSDPSRIWAGVADAMGSQTQNVLLSADGGVTWSNKTPAGAAGTSCRGIAIDPSDSNRVIAAFGGSFGGGSVWFSANGGTSWTNRSAGLPANPMNDVVHDGTRVLLCGGQLFGGQNVGLYETTDDGVTWVPLHDGSWPILAIRDIEIDPASASTIYVGSAGAGIYRSIDGGATWSFGIGGTSAFSVNEICVDPAGGAPVYVGSSSVAVWKSADGTSFAGASVGIGSLNLESVAVHPNDDQELAVAFQGLNDGGVYSTTNGGATWDLEALPGTRYNTVLFAPDGTLYALSDGPSSIAPEGVYRRDGPGAWTGLGPDQGSYFETELFGLTFSTIDPSLIVTTGSDFGYAGYEPTVWVSTDAGASWSKNYEPAGRDSEDVTDVVLLADGTDQNLVASYTDFGAAQTGGAIRSTDGGTSWSEASAGLSAGAQCYGLAASHFDAATVYLADDDYPNGAVYRTTNGGASWTSMGFSGQAHDIATDPVRPLRLYIASWSAPKVRMSDDGGATFSNFDSGLADAGSGKKIELAPGACNTLLLATSNGAYAEYEGGCTLEADTASLSVSAGGTLSMSLAAGPANAARLYLVLGSVTGTDGFPAGSITIPLTWDFYTLDTILQANTGPYVNTLGALDGQGLAGAALVLPAGADPGLIGIQAWYAYGVFSLGPFVAYRASNPIPLTILP
ncbi:MAG: hypothetical protein AB1726_01965 [Planctomycetota bacterium]